MNRQTIEVFHGLMKKGWIDRREDAVLWAGAQETEVWEELEDFKAVMGIDLVRAGDRIYLILTQENDLFLKNNQDYKRDIRADNSIRKRDLYLMNYLSIYLIYLFFGGEGSDPQCREFISKEEFISQFTEHCKQVETMEIVDSGQVPEYGENFIQLAQNWMTKLEGEPDSQKFDCKYGILNRILAKHKIDEIFEIGDNALICPTRKMKDLIPYFLRKDRVAQIQNWIKEGQFHAENQ